MEIFNRENQIKHNLDNYKITYINREINTNNNEVEKNDNSNEKKIKNYSKELNILYNEIREDLSNIDSTGLGKVSENNLLNYLQSKIPPKRNLNVGLFQQLFQDLERDENSDIDLDEFVKKYIHAHEELKLNFDTLKKGFDKERKIKDTLEEKIKKIKKIKNKKK